MMSKLAARPSFVRIITQRLLITSLLAIFLYLVIVVARTYLDEDELNKIYVTRQTDELYNRITIGTQGLVLQSRNVPHPYVGPHAATYAFRILGEGGQVIAERNARLIAELSPWRDKPSRTQDLWVLDLDVERKLYVAGGVRRKIGERYVWIEVATVGDPESTFLGVVGAEVLAAVWMPMIPLVVLTLGVANLSVRRALGSLVRAARQAETMSPLDSADRFDISGMPREVASLALAINGLLDRAGDLLKAQRMFIARAAHELRTPLAIMLLELGRVEDPQVRRLEGDVRAMSETVDRLLTLAKLESIQSPGPGIADLGEIARDLIERFNSLARQTGHRIELSVHEPCRIAGDATALREALRNLIENAVRHTPPGSEVHVTVGPAGSIVVEDNGPGLPTATSEELLQPFRKGRESGTGSGLGLAIVREAVELHRGTIEIGPSPRGGARFVLSIPEAARAAA
jgi:signal transduction histidine kinase